MYYISMVIQIVLRFQPSSCSGVYVIAIYVFFTGNGSRISRETGNSILALDKFSHKKVTISSYVL